MEIIKSVYIIPFMAVLYILYTNMYAPVIPDSSPVTVESDPAVYTIDVGTRDTRGDAVLQESLERVSKPLTRKNITYRLIEKDLIYFSSPVKQNFSRVRVEVKFIDTIPEGYELKAGVKNKKEWSYVWKTLYNPFYSSLEAFNLTGEDGRLRIYSVNNNLTVPVSDFLTSPPAGSTIAIGVPVELSTVHDIKYKDSGTEIKELRGDHTFYIYTKGNLSLSVVKQDLNSYNGSDALEIRLYSQREALIKNTTVPDDGNKGNNGNKGYLQKGILKTLLKEGIYKITMTGGGDFLIRSLQLDSGNIIIQNPLLAGELYTNITRFDLYTKAAKGERLGFITYHTKGLQTINISRGSYIKPLNITTVNEWHYIDLPASNEFYKIEIPKGDIIINSNGFFSLTSDSYFDPLAIKTLQLKSSLKWLKLNKVDYIIVPDHQMDKDGNWTVAGAEFNLSDAYVENNTLNFAISAPHLGKYDYSIPVDWIKIYTEK